MDVWTDLERFSRSFAPKYCEIMTVAPEATPTKKAYKQVDDRARRAHSRQRLGADKLTDNDRVNRVIHC